MFIDIPVIFPQLCPPLDDLQLLVHVVQVLLHVLLNKIKKTFISCVAQFSPSNGYQAAVSDQPTAQHQDTKPPSWPMNMLRSFLKKDHFLFLF